MSAYAVSKAVIKLGRATAKDIADLLGWRLAKARQYLTECGKLGWIKQVGTQHTNRRGGPQVIWGTAITDTEHP